MGRPRKNQEMVLGVDMGTWSWYLAFLSKDGHKEVIADPDGDSKTLAFIGFENGDPTRPLYGKGAANYRIVHPEFVTTCCKRNRSLNATGIIDATGKSWSMEQLESRLLQRLVVHAQDFLGMPIGGLLATVPACFDDARRRATIQIVENAGVRCVGTINEPTAAILAYAMGRTGTFAVSDEGHGTHDVSIIRVEENNRFNIAATTGQNDLGGIEWTAALISHCLEFAKSNGIVLNPEEDLRDFVRIEAACDEAKVALSTQSTTYLSFRAKDQVLDLEITRDLFEHLTAPLCGRIMQNIHDALDKARMTPANIDGVVQVGGGSRVPCIGRAIEGLFGPEKMLRDIDPEKAVVFGSLAGISLKLEEIRAGGDTDFVEKVAPYLFKGQPYLSEITGQALGVEAENAKTGRMELIPVIDQGAPIPCEVSKEFGVSDGDRGKFAINIRILEGTAFGPAQDARVLAEFLLENLPPGPLNNRICITFKIDTNGLVTVDALDTYSNIRIQRQVDARSVLATAAV